MIGILENTGNSHRIKELALRQAQKTPDMGKLVQNLKSIKEMKCNHPIFTPDSGYVIREGMMAIVIETRSMKEGELNVPRTEAAAAGDQTSRSSSSARRSGSRFCAKMSLFADVKDAEGALDELSRAMELRIFQPDECIIREGETGTEMFLLVAGQASVHKNTAEGDQYKVAILTAEKHPFFGEGGLLDSERAFRDHQSGIRCASCPVLGREAF